MNTIETWYRVGDRYFATREDAQSRATKLERKQALAEYIHDAADVPEMYAEDVADLLLERFDTIVEIIKASA